MPSFPWQFDWSREGQLAYGILQAPQRNFFRSLKSEHTWKMKKRGVEEVPVTGVSDTKGGNGDRSGEIFPCYPLHVQCLCHISFILLLLSNCCIHRRWRESKKWWYLVGSRAQPEYAVDTVYDTYIYCFSLVLQEMVEGNYGWKKSRGLRCSFWRK